MKILEVRIDNFSREEILEKIKYFLKEEKFHQIATVNPEFILEAQKDAGFRNILNGCDLNIADGMGIRFAFWKKGEKLKCRIAGADLLNKILKIANKDNLSIFLVANKKGLGSWEETAKEINKIYPNIKVAGADIDKNSNSLNKVKSIDETRIGKYDIIFANFGAPEQEKFLNSQKYGKIRLAIGVGGSFDYLTGKVKRAPIFMRNLGLEWLWRLIQQPKRIKRIISATIVFPLKVVFEQEKNKQK
jgi:N-acetylglucosaminyldiphosphoundecaprenol N-acetyl-beta-D-mannosaminyltransferase